MDSSLLDKNAVSIISSPNKQFYCVVAVDLSDGEILSGPSDLSIQEKNESSSFSYITKVMDKPDYGGSYNNLLCNDHTGPLLKQLICKSNCVESFVSTQRNSRECINDGLFNEISSYVGTSSESLSLSSENTYDADVTVRQNVNLLNAKRSDIENDVARAVTLAETFSPIYAQKFHHRSESYLNSQLEKSRKSPRRKFVRKSKSVQNNFMNTAKDSNVYAKRIYENDDSARVKSHFMRKSPFTADRCYETSKSSEIETDKLTSDASRITSTGQESTNICQAWDEYQVPLYNAISDDSTEEKLDTSCFQEDWLQCSDELIDLSDFGNDNTIQYEKIFSSEKDSDTDTEELHHLMNESYDALKLTKLSLARLKSTRGGTQTSCINEPLATCETNIKCLADLINVTSERSWSVHDISILSDFLKQWEEVECEFHQLTHQDLSLSKSASPTVIDILSDDETVCLKNDICSTETNRSKSTSTTQTTCCLHESGFGTFDKFNIFSSSLYNLTKESSCLLQLLFLSFQIMFFLILLILLVTYFVTASKCLTDMLDIRIQPRLCYIIGPPPA